MNLTISAKFKFLNVTSDQLLDCNVIMHDYRHIAVHQLVWNYVWKLKFGWNCQFFGHASAVEAAIASFSNFGHQGHCGQLIKMR